MSFLDRWFSGTTEAPTAPRRVQPSPDARILSRYRQLVRTAPSEIIEQVHLDAFQQLDDAQRARIYEELSSGAGTGERPLSSEPPTLARAASRAESRVPGTLERSELAPTVATLVVGSTLASAFLPFD